MSSIAPKPILYADDEENDAVLLQVAFRRAEVDHPIRVVNDGTHALDYLMGVGAYSDRDRHPLPCLVLLDIKMPRMTGLQVLERVRQQPEFETLPIVIFSSSEQFVDQQRARELGANEYLVKPASLEGFLAVARQLDARWLAKCRASAHP